MQKNASCCGTILCLALIAITTLSISTSLTTTRADPDGTWYSWAHVALGKDIVDIYNAQRRRVRDPFIQKLFIARLRPLSQGSPVYTSIAQRLSKLVTDDAGMDKSAKEEAAKASPAARADASTQTDEVDDHRYGYAHFCRYGTINNKDRIDSVESFHNIHGGTHHWVGRQETKDSGYKPLILVVCILVMLKIFSWL
ncbi:uncharacterized protein JN550_005980 [Neoarthrinium moseri]|uniref:uncharacterized protein n=1 Tax=Neoarthrinium moseri TaxID=1658444 RepID=UPI001FDE757E|nr:uncharacterized protein JN550_005980 [Neoarthrinium moseri]KAI1869350.1 hypothetical protein JN550_005980 [Neoarthrinium moseri]